MYFRFSFLALMMAVISVSLPLQAQESGTPSTVTDAPLPRFPSNCEALPLVGGQGGEVTKEVSPPGVPIPLPIGSAQTHSNWNTDWFISGDRAYESYMVIFMPRTSKKYDVAMYLKYPDNTHQRFYQQERVDFTANEPITVRATPDRSDIAPYQVNTSIGGIQAIGARYSVTVAGCR